jgi:GNAT superfamily N-acetyltransferase
MREHQPVECGAPAPRVRPAQPPDHPVIRRLLRTAYGPYAAEIAPGTWTAYLADLLDLDRHARAGALLVADVGGTVAGYAAFYPDASAQGTGLPRGWAGGRGLAVHPGFRGHGVATALLADIERRARDVGAAGFAFHTSAFMTTAVELYERLGYRRAPEFDLDVSAIYPAADARPWPALAYLRDLSPQRAACAA